jgi:hypothetical protein
VDSVYAREKRKSDQAGLVAHTKHIGDDCRGLTAHSTLSCVHSTPCGGQPPPCKIRAVLVPGYGVSHMEGRRHVSTAPHVGGSPLPVRYALCWYPAMAYLTWKGVATYPQHPMWEVERLEAEAVSRRFPFKTGCLPLKYSSNSGVNGVSYRGNTRGRRYRCLRTSTTSFPSCAFRWGGCVYLGEPLDARTEPTLSESQLYQLSDN